MLQNGWWLVTSLYMVVDAGLSPAQLLVIAAVQGVASSVFEIPAGVVSDTIGRKAAIVTSHALMAAAMITTGLSSDFLPLMVAQVLWGIAGTFASGSDVAWATDEIDQPERMHLLIAAQGRWQMIGSGAGIVVFGALATILNRPAAIAGAGVLMLVLGAWFTVAFPEDNFVRVRKDHLRVALGIARRGARLVVTDRTVCVLVIVTVLVNGAGDSFARVYPVQLSGLGLPSGMSGTVWFTAISLAGYAFAVLALAVAQNRLHDDHGARAALALSCATGLISFVLVGLAPNLTYAIVGVVIANGIAMPLIRTITTIWVNRRTANDIRATTHSFMAQAEYVGEIVCASSLAGVSGAMGAGNTVALAASLFAASAAVLALARVRGADPTSVAHASPVGGGAT
ncbi:MFS transporter [Streptomyces sp. 8K308]|uniref:MFS transporter n=1 Tax=Streptomyces sp. 8K308 TaxID=2530388 RepID=UPI001A9FD277|nr:MFS transporter [Streptomyces sp. 8K308]